MSIIALDLGTTACKVSVFTEELELIGCSSAEYPTHHTIQYGAEQNAEEWWSAVEKATRLLFDKNPEAVKQSVAVGVSGHMMGLLAVDSDGEQLFPSMIHMDTRSQAQAKELDETIGGDTLYYRSGNVLSASSSLCKALWLKQNNPEIYGKTARFLQSKDYLVYRLTNNMDSTDYSDASHGVLIDIHKKEYLTDVMQETGISVDKFPILNRSTTVVGKVCAEASRRLHIPEGIPVVAGGGDGACASTGAGISFEGDMYCSLGTSAWLAYNSLQPFVDKNKRVFNIMSLDGESVGVFGTMAAAGKVVDWVSNLFGISIQDLNKIALESPPGCEGLVFLPYLEGERSPIFDPAARGVYFGLTPIHENKHMLRAAMEGVAYALRSILDVMREQGDFENARIIGGGAKSRLWKQIIADICCITIQDVTSSSDSVTSLGAAIAAGVGIGLFSNIHQAVSKISVHKEYYPNEGRIEYQKGYSVYKALYPQLRPVYAMEY